YADPRRLPPFPTRRSSDLELVGVGAVDADVEHGVAVLPADRIHVADLDPAQLDAGRLVEGPEAGRLQVQAEGRVPGHGRRVEGRSEEHTSELQSPDHLVCR